MLIADQMGESKQFIEKFMTAENIKPVLFDQEFGTMKILKDTGGDLSGFVDDGNLMKNMNIESVQTVYDKKMDHFLKKWDKSIDQFARVLAEANVNPSDLGVDDFIKLFISLVPGADKYDAEWALREIIVA